MAALGNQTLANEYTSYYLRAGSTQGGVPSPFAVVDETGGIRGSKVVISSADDTGAMTNVDASGNTLGSVTMNPAGAVALVSKTPPTEGYNLIATDNQVRAAVPLIVQHGTAGGVKLSNDGSGNGILQNSVTAPGNTPASIVMDQLGNVVVGGSGSGTANTGGLKVFTYNGGSSTLSQLASPGSSACVQTVPNEIRFLDSASVTRGGIGLAGTTQTNVKGHNVAVITNSDLTPVQAATFDSSGNTTLTGNLTLTTAGADLTMNNGDIQYAANLQLNNGGAIGGVGTINMVNGSGYASGTINGVANIPTAGGQPIQFPGYNPGYNTPLFTITAGGAIANANYTQASVLNDVYFNAGGIALGNTSSGSSFFIQNLFMMYPSTSPAGDYYGTNAITIFDFTGKPPGSYWMYFVSGEGGEGVVYTYWNGSTIAAPSVNRNNNGYQNQFDVPKNGTTSQIGYAYYNHAAQGNGVTICVRTA